jgi:preprotein translocase subunit SecE
MATNPAVFLKEVRSELGKVVWPSRKEAVRLTSLVIGISLAVGLFIGAFDFIFTKTMAIFLKP